MKYVFKDIGHKKINKTVELVIPPGTGYQALGFDSVLDFLVCEAAPHFQGEKKKLEAVAVDGMPDMVATRYVIVYGGIHNVGSVSLHS